MSRRQDESAVIPDVNAPLPEHVEEQPGEFLVARISEVHQRAELRQMIRRLCVVQNALKFAG